MFSLFLKHIFIHTEPDSSLFHVFFYKIDELIQMMRSFFLKNQLSLMASAAPSPFDSDTVL